MHYKEKTLIVLSVDAEAIKPQLEANAKSFTTSLWSSNSTIISAVLVLITPSLTPEKPM